MPTSPKVVGLILMLVVPTNTAETEGEEIWLKAIVGVVSSGSAKEGIGTFFTEFIDTDTDPNVVLPSVKYGGLLGTVTVIV